MALTVVWVPALVIGHALGVALLIYALEQSLGLVSWLVTASSSRTERESDSDCPVLPSLTSDGKTQPDQGPVLAANLSWKGVGCTAQSADKRSSQRVLDDCYGCVLPGEITGFMGPSGAGKTTLLNILAQRKAGKRVDGSILMNSQPLGQLFQRVSAYVTQEDVFVAMLTAHETLQFVAALTLPPAISFQAREQRIRSVLTILGLLHVKGTKVGGVLPGGIVVRGLSGGEKRRLSIACALISRPSVMFLDEPTTGLDSFAALTVMEHLAALAALGHTVIASIHQPRPAIFEKFHKVCLLSTGRQLYFGPPGGAADWFGSLGYAYDAARDGGLADWLIDLVSVGFHKPKQAARTMTTAQDVHQAAEQFLAAYQGSWRCSSEDGGAAGPSLTTGAPAEGSHEVAVAIPEESRSACCGCSTGPFGSSRYISSWTRQCSVLLRRCFLEQLRNPTDTASRIFMGCWIGLLTGLVFYNLQPGPDSAQSRISVLFFILLAQQLMPFTYMSFYVANRRFFAADVAAGIYSPSAFYAANSVASFPFVLVNGVLGTLVAYGLAGLRGTASAVFLNALFAGLEALISTQLLISCVWLTPNQDLAYIMATGYVTASILLSGFYIRINQISIGFLRALSWATYTKYALSGVARLELAGVVWPDVQCSAQPATRGSTSAGTCFESGDTVLQYWGYGIPVYINALALVGFLILMHAISFAALSKLQTSA